MKEINEATFSTRRLEALTDGVFAIAMTLLVLDLTTSELGDLHSSADLWNALLQESSGFISFGVSFLLLGSLWAVHTRQFEFIKSADRRMLFINNLRLFTVVLVPLTTSLSASYDSLVLGRSALMCNFFLITLVSYWQWWYATIGSPDLASAQLTPRMRNIFNQRNRDIVILAFVAFIASLFIGNLAALIFALQPFTAKLRKHRSI